MEAVEFSMAESPSATRIIASMFDLQAQGRSVFVPARLLPREHAIAPRDELTWLLAHSLKGSREFHIPLDSAALVPNAAERRPFSQSSNGLGAGFSLQEATVHGWCELIERDASSIWSLRSLYSCAGTEIDLLDAIEPSTRRCIERVRDAGFELRLFDLTTDLRVPVIMAFLWQGKPRLYFDVASGVCAHPRTSKAIEGAVLEAAQTRVSNIAGARDDIEPEDYDKPLPSWIAQIVSSASMVARAAPPSLDDADFTALSGDLSGSTFVVPLSQEDDCIFVVKVMSNVLEDRQTNCHWRPGRRAIAAMTEP
jgi:thiazole/oxazole-forming peptide maturase SagD family component